MSEKYDEQLMEILAILECVDVDPDFDASMGILRPEVYTIRGSYAFGFGPDHNIWITCGGDNLCDWLTAIPLYVYMESQYGELFKLRAASSAAVLHILAQYADLVRDLVANYLTAE